MALPARRLLLLQLLLGVLIAPDASANASRMKEVSCDGLPVCPFDNLSADEIKATLRIINGLGPFPGVIKYPIIRAQEPKKADWLSGSDAGRRRRAHAALFDMNSNLLTEMIVDLDAEQITDIRQLPDGISPALIDSEYDEAEQLVRANPQWQAAVRRRGITPDEARLDIWAPGPLSREEEGGEKRILRAITNYQDPKSRFWYWAVVEGLTVTVDLHQRLVTSVWDDEVTNITSGIEELPDFDDKPQLKPLVISQPEGSSIRVEGQRLSWYKWRFQYSMDPIFGLQFFHITYDGDCEQRSVIYKISMAEMFVPYGGKGRAWRWRSAFDAGEYGIGKNANELKRGLDVPENAVLFDCVVADDVGGEPHVISGCVGAFERDYGLLYKHTDTFTGDTDGRRGRSLVVTMMTTIANYDYTFDYVFQMDGTLEVRSRLTGIILARGAPQQVDDPNCLTNCSNLLNDYLLGPPHQHFFNYRIDLDVDGLANHFVEVDLTADPIGPENPDSGVFSAKKTLVTEEGFRDHDFHNHRTWHVVNANSRNDFGSPRGYALRPETVAFTYLTDANPFLAHAQFVKHAVWVTRFKDEEQTPTDKYPRTGLPNEGLPKYVEDGEGVENEDVVVWYTYGVTHSTRPEEWPIMNVHHAGFSLVPFNFLSQNSEMPLKDKCH